MWRMRFNPCFGRTDGRLCATHIILPMALHALNYWGTIKNISKLFFSGRIWGKSHEAGWLLWQSYSQCHTHWPLHSAFSPWSCSSAFSCSQHWNVQRHIPPVQQTQTRSRSRSKRPVPWWQRLVGARIGHWPSEWSLWELWWYLQGRYREIYALIYINTFINMRLRIIFTVKAP